MRSRRYHKKSRLGCVECKSRRIKCDEARPTCSGCVRTGDKCHYPQTQTAPITFVSFSEPSGASTSPETPPVLSISPSPGASQTPAFDSLDLMLMHHYSVETSRQLFYGDRQHQVWQRDIPALAASNNVLLHGLLALAALHKSRTDITQHTLYRTRALHHHAAGLEIFNNMVAAANAANSEVLITFSILIGVWVFAFPNTETSEADRPSLNDILDMLEVIRGSKAVILLHRDNIAHTPIGIFLIPPLSFVRPKNEDDWTPAHRLFDELHLHESLPSARSAIYILNTLLERFLSGKDHSRSAATSWGAIVGEDFWKRLRAHDPVAIFIFAHNAMLLRCSEDGYWWLEGWAERILQACDGALSAEDKLRFDWEATVERIRAVGEELSRLNVPDDPDLGWS